MSVGQYESPRWSHELTDCSLPMAFDQYSICSFGCLYCFSQFQKSVALSRIAYENKIVRQVNVDQVKNIWQRRKDNVAVRQFGPYLDEGLAFQWGSLADPFCEFERKRGVGLELMRFFASVNQGICYSTKGTWWTRDPRYFGLFEGRDNWHVKFSIITADARAASIIERGVDPPKERLKAMEKLARATKGTVTLRLRPYIIGVSNKTARALIRSAASAGAQSITTEFLCLDTRARGARVKYSKMSDVAGFDLYAYYGRYSRGSGYWRLNRAVKEEYVQEMEEAAAEVGMRFYVSDADFKERCSTGSCCGLPEGVPWSKGQFTEALLIAKRKGRVRFSDIEPHMSFMRSVQWMNAKGFNKATSEAKAKYLHCSLADYMRHLWNNPNEFRSPYKMFNGMVVPVGKDRKGDVIYKYTGEEES
ncbi:MAG: hypothetical protein WC683_03870 [bacterium]